MPPPPSFTPPNHWRTTSQCWDDQAQYGFKLYRTVQPTAWSRKRGLAGQDPLQIPLSALTRHGIEEASLRALSEGRFVGVVCAKSVAESVFSSQLLKSFRDQGIDIDACAESLHRQIDPHQVIPNKSEKPIEFMSPLIQLVIDKIKAQCPVKQDTTAMRQLQETEAKLKAAQQKLHEAGIPVTPKRSTRHVSDPDLSTGPFEEEPAHRNTGLPVFSGSAVASVSDTKPNKRGSAVLGASPKTQSKPKQRKLENMFNRAAEPTPENQGTGSTAEAKGPPASTHVGLQIEDILSPTTPSLRNHQLTGTTAPTIKKWFATFDVETQQLSKKVLDIIKSSKTTKEELQQASTQYGLKLADVLKLSVTSLQQAVAIGSALSA